MIRHVSCKIITKFAGYDQHKKEPALLPYETEARSFEILCFGNYEAFASFAAMIAFVSSGTILLRSPTTP